MMVPTGLSARGVGEQVVEKAPAMTADAPVPVEAFATLPAFESPKLSPDGTGRKWKSYVLRRSITTLAGNCGAAKWDLDGFMGHNDRSQTDIHAIGEIPNVITAVRSIMDDIEKLVPEALHRNLTGTTGSTTPAEKKKV